MPDNILFSIFYTGLFLLFRKKTGGARAPLAPPLATALCSQDFGHVMKQFGHKKENKEKTEVSVGSKVDYARYGVSTSQWNYNVKLMLVGWETFINFKQDTGVN